MKVRHGESELLTTQCYIAGDPANARDGILNSSGNDALRRADMAEFKPAGDGGELTARLDVVLGKTPKA